MAVALTWEQIGCWRVKKQHLVEQAPRNQMLTVVRNTCGIQAQVMSSAEMAIAARVKDITSEDVQTALWQDKTLVKAWTMRGTLHLMTASDMPLYVAALGGTRRARIPDSWLKYHKVTAAEIAAITEGVAKALDNRNLTREQLADTIATEAGNPHLKEVMLSGWGSLLKPASYQGYLCFGPSQGQNVTFVRPDQWLGSWEKVDPTAALKEVMTRHLTVYGPSNPDQFYRWWGVDLKGAKQIFKSMGEVLTEVELEGWKGFILTADITDIQNTTPKGLSVRLLGNFDPYTLALNKNIEYFLPQAYKPLVSRTSGWISSVVLINGRIMGVWKHEAKKKDVTITISPFPNLPSKAKPLIKAEGERWSGYFGAPVKVVYE